VLKVLTVLQVRVLQVRVLLMLPLLTLTACVPGSVPVAAPRGATVVRVRMPSTVRVQVREGSAVVVREVPLEEYVAVTALSEVHPDARDEQAAERMFEVQAIIARTYAVSNVGRHGQEGFDLCSTTHCQLYEPARMGTSRWAAVARDAARRTAGKLVWFGDAPAHALFHADCGGHTSDATAVWGGAGAPYLVAAPDDCPAEHAEWVFETPTSALRAALNADARTEIGRTLDRIDVAGRDVAGRAEMITLRGTRTFLVRGEAFRDAVSRAFGARSLRSTLFTVKRTGDRFIFSGRGFGHGVGLCQAGALARLRAGASTNAVLQHYFPGTVLR
jgi:stage II sporulation protein D